MKNTRFSLSILLLTTLFMSSCSSDDTSTEQEDTATIDTDTNTSNENEDNTTDEEVINTDLFYVSEGNVLSDFELVDCTLSDGTETQCYKIVINNSLPEGGSDDACPDTKDDVGGLGIYDESGLHILNEELWDEFLEDGYNIYEDDDYTVTSVEITNGPGGAKSLNTDEAVVTSDFLEASCLLAPLNDMSITYYIPAYPVVYRETTTATTDYWGISLDGLPYAEAPPSAVVTIGGGDVSEIALPSLDACGGHLQPDGPYHWHIVPQVINALLEQEGLSDTDFVECTIEQSNDAILGYARDGFPIYGSEDSDGITPSDLDDCSGHTGATSDFDEIYHYHITNVLDTNSDTGYTNILPCTNGATVVSAESSDAEFASYEFN